MIAYTDSKYAEYWGRKSNDYDGFWKALKKNLEDALSGNEKTKSCIIIATFLLGYRVLVTKVKENVHILIRSVVTAFRHRFILDGMGEKEEGGAGDHKTR